MKREDEREDQEIKRDREFFFFQKMFENPQTRQMNDPKMFRKNLFRTNYSSFSSKVQNLTVFSVISMIRIRFFGPGELFQRRFRAARY